MKKYIALIISIMPANILRIFFYNKFPNYHISYTSKIGIGTIISTRSATINHATLGRFNKFSGNFDLIIEEGSHIVSSNEFVCTENTPGTACLNIGKHAHITVNHFFDVSGGIMIKDYTRIAGRFSQFWTHGGQRKKTSIIIHEKCYIASAVRFSQGVEIASNSFVALSSVVLDSFEEPDVLILGYPAKIVKRGIIARLSLVDK